MGDRPEPCNASIDLTACLILMEERGDLWSRYQSTGEREYLRVHHSRNRLYDFFFKEFGYAAPLIGLLPAFLMIYAFLQGAG